jgi:hypothetical protein
MNGEVCSANYFEAPESVEARAIMRLVLLGTSTLDDARDLISIPDKQEQALNLFVAVAGKDGASIARAVAFRRRVSEEFEKLADLMASKTSVVV